MNHPTATHWTYVHRQAGKQAQMVHAQRRRVKNMREIYPKREHAKADIIHD